MERVIQTKIPKGKTLNEVEKSSNSMRRKNQLSREVTTNQDTTEKSEVIVENNNIEKINQHR